MVDLLIIGAGPGGYEAALEARKNNLSVTMIDDNAIGGTCLHVGCIPSKTMHHIAETMRGMRQLTQMGMKVELEPFSLEPLWMNKDKVVQTLTDDITALLKAAQVNMVFGRATLVDAHTVEVNGEKIEATNILLATGSRAVRPNIPGINLPGVVDSTTLLSLTKLPEHLIVIGGGYIGLEWATIFSALGSEVSIVEFMPTLLPSADEDIAKRIAVLAKRDGINLHLSTAVSSIEKIDGRLIVNMDTPTPVAINGDVVLVATGRKPNIEMLNLNQVKVDYSPNGIRVNNVLQTSVESIYAIGDCIGAPMLAHKASFQGKQVVAHIAHRHLDIDFAAIPSVVFSFPEIASVGLTEAEVKLKGIIYETKRIPLRSNGKAVANGETDGFLKVILDPDKKLLGAHIICAQANTLISELALMYHLGRPLTEYTGVIHVHPTLSEIVQTLLQSL